MKKLVYNVALALCAMVTINSCSLDEYNPMEVTGEETLATFDGWYGMQTQCYNPIYSQLYTVTDFLSVAEAGTDTWLTANNNDNSKELFYYESLTPSKDKAWDKLFMQAYTALGICNTVINRAESVEGNADDIRVLTAEARCLRGFYHLILTTYFGPITLCMNEAGNNIVLEPKRNTLSEIYSYIIDDLKYAADNLNTTPYGNNRARVSKKSAMGLLARAYIQGAGQGLSENGVSYWQRAADVAESFIADTEAGGGTYGGYLYKDISDMWADGNNRTNKEALFVAAGCDAGDDDAWDYRMRDIINCLRILTGIRRTCRILVRLHLTNRTIFMDVPTMATAHHLNICWTALNQLGINVGRIHSRLLSGHFLWKKWHGFRILRI